jgi:hypothetical protein
MRRSVVWAAAIVLLASCGGGDAFTGTTGGSTTTTGTSDTVGEVETSTTTTTGTSGTVGEVEISTTTTLHVTIIRYLTDAAVWTSPDGLSWSRVPHDDAVFGGTVDQVMASVTAGGPGLVAVGWDWTTGRGRAAVWTSRDGLRWSRVAHDPGVLGGDWSMSGVTAGGPGLVAVGHDWSFGGDAAVWVSPDGFEWSRVSSDEEIFNPEGTVAMDAVSAGGPGLVAVGSRVWTSPDGLAWSLVPDVEGIFERADMTGVTAGGPGVVAVGVDRSVGPGRVAAVWTSPDGVEWSRVEHDEGVFGGLGACTMAGVATGGPGLVAVGACAAGADGEDQVAAVWISPDGLTWSRVAHDPDAFDGPGTHAMNAVVAGGPGLVAVGANVLGRDDGVAVVWTSPDGLTWSRVPHDETAFGDGEKATRMLAVTAGGPGLVAVGSADTEEWVRE